MSQYTDLQDVLDVDGTSHLSPYLHFGFISAVELADRAARCSGTGADGFVRQLAWRDFHHQVLAARPKSAWQDYRDRGNRLTKTLYLDWRLGAQHFLDHLLDGDIANNNLNWQWVAGTGTDTRPNRVLNPLRQAERFDSSGDYVRRWVPELADVGSGRHPSPMAAFSRTTPVTALSGSDR